MPSGVGWVERSDTHAEQSRQHGRPGAGSPITITFSKGGLAFPGVGSPGGRAAVSTPEGGSMAELLTYRFECEGHAASTFSVARFTGEEGISQLYRFEIDLVSEDPDID